MSSSPRDDFDAELEREVEKVLSPGEERRRQVAMSELHAVQGAGVAGRVIGVALALAIGVAGVQALALLLGLDLLGDLCRAAGMCG